METKIKRMLAILLAACFLLSITATAVSADSGGGAGGSPEPQSNVAVKALSSSFEKPD